MAAEPTGLLERRVGSQPRKVMVARRRAPGGIGSTANGRSGAAAHSEMKTRSRRSRSRCRRGRRTRGHERLVDKWSGSRPQVEHWKKHATPHWTCWGRRGRCRVRHPERTTSRSLREVERRGAGPCARHADDAASQAQQKPSTYTTAWAWEPESRARRRGGVAGFGDRGIKVRVWDSHCH